jgi:hypothetical protein
MNRVAGFFYLRRRIIMPGTITGTLTRLPVRLGSAPMVEIVLACTADAAVHTFPAEVITALSGISDYGLTGLKLYSIKAIPDLVTPPTDKTSITITDKYGLDLLGGKGSELISNTSKVWAPFGPSGFALPALITGLFTINLTGNLVDSAKLTIVLELAGD